MKLKSILYGLAALPGLASLILSLTGQGKAALISAGVSALVSLVLSLIRLISAVRGKKAVPILLQVLLLVALLMLSAGLAGMAYVSMSGLSQQSFDQNIESMQRMSPSLSPYASGIMKLLGGMLLLLAKYRRILLLAGGGTLVFFLLVQFLISLWKNRKPKSKAASPYARPEAVPDTMPAQQPQWTQDAQQAFDQQQWAQPVPQDPQQPSWVQPEQQAEWQVPQQGFEAPLPQWQAAQQPAFIPITPDHCCICGALLQDGCATLFENPDGTEALIDQSCWSRINASCNGTDPQEINEAISFFNDQLPYVSPSVAEYMKSYIQAGEQLLSEGR